MFAFGATLASSRENQRVRIGGVGLPWPVWSYLSLFPQPPGQQLRRTDTGHPGRCLHLPYVGFSVAAFVPDCSSIV